MRTSGRAALLCAVGLFCAGSCALAPVRRTRFFPARERLADGWTASAQGRLAAAQARLLCADGHLFAHIEVRNEASDPPLRLVGLRVFDKDGARLAEEPLSGDARLSKGLAAAVAEGFYKERAEAAHQAAFIRQSAYKDGPVAKGASTSGLAAFVLAEGTPPFALELELSDGASSETLTFVFKEFGPEEFWDNPELVMQDPARFFRALRFEQRQDAFEDARRMRRDRAGFVRMKTADPKRYELLEWVRIHEYDIEF